MPYGLKKTFFYHSKCEYWVGSPKVFCKLCRKRLDDTIAEEERVVYIGSGRFISNKKIYCENCAFELHEIRKIKAKEKIRRLKELEELEK